MHNHFDCKPLEQTDKRYVAMLTAVGTAIGLGAGTAATVGGAVVVGAAAYGGYKAISGAATSSSPTSTTPTIQALPEAPSVQVAETQAKESIEKKRRAVARNKTVYTGPLGLSEEDKSNLATKTMLGE